MALNSAAFAAFLVLAVTATALTRTPNGRLAVLTTLNLLFYASHDWRYAFGIVGLETLLPLCIKALIEPGHLSWPELIGKLTWNPAKILGLDGLGTLHSGATSDVTLINPGKEWSIDVNAFASKSRNSPYQNLAVKGRAHIRA